jgi:polar amino acid transport system substrate-binding protein
MSLIKFLLINVLLITSSYASKDSVTLQLQWKHQFQFAGYYMAKEKDFYDEVNLDVKLLEYKMDVTILDNVLNGKVNFATGRSSLIIDRSKGKKVVLLSSILQSSPIAMVSKKFANINTIEDFKNKTISITDQEAHSSLYPLLLSKSIDFKSLK